MDAIELISQQEINALNTADVEAFVAMRTEDTVLMAPNEPSVTGKQAALTWTENFFKQFTFNLSISNQQVEVVGDWAFEQYSVSGTFTPKAGGKPVEEAAKCIHILRRQPDGSWKITHDIWNFDTPLPGGG